MCKFSYDYADSNNLLSNDQCCFHSGSSTVDQLLLTYKDIPLAVGQDDNVDLVHFYFSQAFDVVCHDVLLEK